MQSIDKKIAAELDALSKKRDQWESKKDICLPIIDAMGVIGEFYCDWVGSLDFRITGDKHKLAGAVRVLRTRGWESKSDPPKPGETWVAKFHNPKINFSVFIVYSSTVCRRVKVGTKTVEQDVYEIVCDEQVLA